MTLRLEDYALIGDCQTAALVGRNGSIDWLCWPRFDSGACFANLLGTTDNGCWSIAPADASAKATRAYRGHTLILETHFETAEGAAVVIDFMPIGTGASHIVRLVRGLRGSMSFKTELVVRFDYGGSVPWMRRHDDDSLHAVAGPDRIVLQTPILLEPEGRTHAGTFDVKAGETIDFTLSYSVSYENLPPSLDPQAALERTERSALAWGDRFEGAGQWSDAVIRSLLTLRALIYQKSGGIVAAPTMSLPEQLGGPRNWDYRFCWLRDATFTLLALMNGGFHDEARRWRNWLLRAVGGQSADLQILYGLGGERRVPEFEVPWLSGYEGSQPVRIGNAAASQLQLDIYGEVMDALYQSRASGRITDDQDWSLQCELLKYLETIWDQPDEGIWEVRGGRRHFTYSKIMTWVAFDRGVKSIENFGFSGPLEHWREIRQRIHDDVCTKAYDPKLGAFTQSYGSSELDASVLLMSLVGFLPPTDDRVRTTVEAIEANLMVNGLVARYRTEAAHDGLPGGEGVFLACSFWLVDNLVLLGRTADAHALFDRLLSLRNDVGLLSEEYDTNAKRLVGNFPQAFSHIALINSAYNLAHADKPVEQRSGHMIDEPAAA